MLLTIDLNPMSTTKPEKKCRPCEPLDTLLMSNPPQYKCKNCGGTWVTTCYIPRCTAKPTDRGMSWEERFDKKFGDPMEKKYGKGFVLYCSFCRGEWRDEIKGFIRSELASREVTVRRETLEEAIKVAEGMVPVDDGTEYKGGMIAGIGDLVTRLEGLAKGE